MPGVAPAAHPLVPWLFGLALIGTGTVGMSVAVWMHIRMRRYLWQAEFKSIAGLERHPEPRPVIATALLLIVLGVVAFGVVLLRLSLP